MKATFLFPFLFNCLLCFALLSGCTNDSSNSTKESVDTNTDSNKTKNLTPNSDTTEIEDGDEMEDSDEIGDGDEETYPIREAFFLNGLIGEFPIEMYLWTNTIVADTLFLEGQYWYTNHHKPMEVNGYYLPSKQKLWLNYKEKETFDLTTFDGKKGSGSWSKKSTVLNCSLKAVETANFDWLTHCKVLFKDYKFVKIYIGTEQNWVGVDPLIDIIKFNNWTLSFIKTLGPGDDMKTYSFQRLVASVPTLVFLCDEIISEEKKDKNGNVMDSNDLYMELTEATLWTYENSTWKKKELDYLSKDINLYHETKGDISYLQTSPNSIVIGEKIWIWDGQQFIPKTK